MILVVHKYEREPGQIYDPGAEKFINCPWRTSFHIAVNANPAPLGFELDKASILDVKKKHEIIKCESNHWKGYNYHIDISNIKLDGLTNLLIICNDANVIQAVIFTINRNKFTEFCNTLSKKYTLVKTQNPYLYKKEIKYTNGHCSIILEVSTMSHRMSLTYITNNFFQRFKTKQQEEQKLQ